MRTAEKMLAIIVGILLLVAFINRGTIGLGSDSQGASVKVGYAGWVK